MTLSSVPRYDGDRISRVDGHAVVVGASMAGMLAARVLADRYRTVTVLDQDPLIDEPIPRDGVPQGTQPHALLEGGRATIEDLFPGYCEALLDAGGVEVDTSTDVSFYDDDVELARSGVERSMYCASRPLFELLVRRRLATVEGVTLRGGCTLLDYLFDDRSGAVTGVRHRDETGDRATLGADLVVDATGRTSSTPVWLAEHGYTKPALDEVHIDLLYGTVRVERPPGDRRTVLLPASHPNPRGGVLVPVEGDRWILNLHGFHGDHPPAEVDSFQQWASGLPNEVLADILAEEPITSDSVDRYPIPYSRRYRYEDLDQFPDGLLAIGDAIASYNPIYAQGMTVAAFEALHLHHTLAASEEEVVATEFFEAASSVIDTAWTLGVAPDFEFPETDGPRPRGSRFGSWYISRLQRRARTDPFLTEALTQVIQFERPASSLFRPRVLWRVITPIPGLLGSGRPTSTHTGGSTPTDEER